MFMLTFTFLVVSLTLIKCNPENSTRSVISISAEADLQDDKERIIGGEPAIDGDLKYQLSLRFHLFHHCGASLVQIEDTQLAITAAHCTIDFEPEDFQLVAGDVRLSDRSGKEQLRQVTKTVNHEAYDPDTISNDIGLVFFDSPFVLNDYVGTIPLPEQGQETKGTAIVSGWGVYSYHEVYSDNLTKVEVPIVDDEVCRKAYAPLEYAYFDHFICAGFLGAGIFKDSCKGDSGGPVKSVEHGYLAGIVSWSEGCAHPKFPGVNTEVSHFIDWINEEVSKYSVAAELEKIEKMKEKDKLVEKMKVEEKEAEKEKDKMEVTPKPDEKEKPEETDKTVDGDSEKVDGTGKPEEVEQSKKPEVKEKEKPDIEEKPDVEEMEKPEVEDKWRPEVEEKEKPDVEEKEKPDVDENEKPDVEEKEKPELLEGKEKPKVEQKQQPQSQVKEKPDVEIKEKPDIEKEKPDVDEKEKPDVEEKEKPEVEEKEKPDIEEKEKPDVEEKVKPNVEDKEKPDVEEIEKPDVDEKQKPDVKQKEKPGATEKPGEKDNDNTEDNDPDQTRSGINFFKAWRKVKIRPYPKIFHMRIEAKNHPTDSR